MSQLVVRPEAEADQQAIHAVNLAAFGQPMEAELVDRLRPRAAPFLSWVADLEDQIVGHILFTPITIDHSEEPPTAGLAPMAVEPSRQRHGIGSALVERGLSACRKAGFEAVVVLGHPDYYPRFGFRRASRWLLRYETPVPDEVFMALELRQGALEDGGGVVRYHTEFSAL